MAPTSLLSPPLYSNLHSAPPRLLQLHPRTVEIIEHSNALRPSTRLLLNTTENINLLQLHVFQPFHPHPWAAFLGLGMTFSVYAKLFLAEIVGYNYA